MTDTASEQEVTPAARMGKAILKGAAIGLPLAIVLLTVVVYFAGDVAWNDAFATAILPGVLLGGFGGGFAGMAATMDDH